MSELNTPSRRSNGLAGAMMLVTGALMLALAGVSFAQVPGPDARALAVAESAVNYCSLHDPAAAQKLRQSIKDLVHGSSEQRLAQLRTSTLYQSTYRSVADFADKLNDRNAPRFCAEAAAKRK